MIEEKRNLEFQRMSEWIAYDLDIATGIGDGYSKNVTLPDIIVGETYNVLTTTNIVVVNSSGNPAIFPAAQAGRCLPGQCRRQR